MEATGARAGRSVFLAFGASRTETTLDVQSELAGLGLVIRRLVRDFNVYVGAGVLGGSSDLYELATSTYLVRSDRSACPGAPECLI